MIRAVAVVVPAHDEETTLGPCLASIGRALRHPALDGLTTGVFVAADSCRDGTARTALAHGAHVLDVAVRSAGAARAHATAWALARPGFAAVAADEVWLAHTDADTRVPPSWLAGSLADASRGFHAVLGTVAVDDWSEHLPATAARYLREYAVPGADGHPHVHAANLAVRADAYLAAGGFPPVATGEDHALAAALEAGGHRIRRTRRDPVLTSARRTHRAPEGFGARLLHLEAALRTPG